MNGALATELKPNLLITMWETNCFQKVKTIFEKNPHLLSIFKLHNRGIVGFIALENFSHVKRMRNWFGCCKVERGDG